MNGLVSLADRGVIELAGADATVSSKAITNAWQYSEREGRYAGLLTPQGKLRSFILLFHCGRPDRLPDRLRWRTDR
jgi:folate-binding Fe-S cluster repair protein YgfZ